MATLNKQVWIRQLMSKFYPETSFLEYVTNLSNLVENDKINLAEAGVDPNVLINNNTYPIAVSQRVDTPLEIELDKFETENTLIRKPDQAERAYQQLESVLMGHRNMLRITTAMKAAHAYAPQTNSEYTPVLETTGGNDGDGNKRLLVGDILRLKRRYDDLNYPLDKRFLVLTSRHLEDLLIEDLKTFKDIADVTNGQPKTFAGFKMLQFSNNAIYNRTTLQKKSFGAVAVGSDGFCSFSFISEEVMKADGAVYMFSQVDDPKERATIVGFDKRFIALPFRNKGIGAIVSAAVS